MKKPKKEKDSSYEEEWGNENVERKQRDKARRNKKGRKSEKKFSYE